MMHEGVADVHNDPLLFTHCMLDLQHFCNDIPFGSGKSKRQCDLLSSYLHRVLCSEIVCLLEVYTTNKPRKLSDECSHQVSLRVDMWDSAVKVSGH